ncbi:MAG: hypothetical protein HC769_05125 [Cyanobacteria bacterium CRU_2_1]|nr:hypothetical protein [Cyanobacteria bacterium CRU_2_1]
MKSYSPSSKSDLFSVDSIKFVTFAELAENTAETEYKSSSKISIFDRLWQSLLNGFLGNSEPKIYQKRDRYGDVYFRVYDPMTGTSSSFKSEQEVRIWLDQRYYQ